MSRRLALLLPLVLCACQKGPDPQQLNASAQFFLDNGGLTLLSRTGQAGTQPCLKPLNMKQTLLGGPFGASERLVDFVERHQLAKTRHEQRPSGYEGVTFTPVAPYENNWVGQGDYKNFCFGKITLVKAEAVPDAKTITAGEAEPYIIPGTEARATRITYRLEDVPGGSFVDDLKAAPNLLVRGSLLPKSYGKDLTVVATLPLKPENFNVKP
ncbi:hypothetical protein DAETH_09720 [Deinococcus aetherius]|uniref:Lipoprotein n=1 Tax=Deinococcus aetherius TaxID=200252 RepID=A0ABN6RG35_9DEIO|nr:hypothetical protein [Deinococcus aetherius]BDP41003.1 hypothetical protein DAETH_09720 [Deinococcus aetherius]